jgi:Tfp pilus assembly protein PilX
MTSSGKSAERGSALFFSILVALAIVSISGVVLTVSMASGRLASAHLRRARLRGLAESAIAAAHHRAWNEYLSSRGGKAGNPDTYAAYLGNTLKIANGAQGTLFDQQSGEGDRVVATLARRDVVTGDSVSEVYATIAANATSGEGDSFAIEAVFKIGGKPFEGFRYGLLTNNVNCILCHARFDNIERVYNRDPAKRGTFNRVKVASLESLLLRTDSADSVVAGTVYTRGAVVAKDGTPLDDLKGTYGGKPITFDGYQIDAAGHIVEDPVTGALTKVDLAKATGTPLPQFANFYKDYPVETSAQTDGELPERFPPPIPDLNQNKVVDGAEFDAVRAKATGTLSGGVIYEVAGTYNDSKLPVAGNRSAIAGTSSGTVILVGTATNPITIDGMVAIDGDVVISGVVKGTGQIAAKGNMYIMGDVKYADGTDASGQRTFGVAADGTQNTIALSAGGNVLAGDYLSDANGRMYTNTAKLFTASEIGLFNRREWTKTQPTLPDATGVQRPNSTYDPNYKPRYYTMKPGDPVYIYVPPVPKDPKTGKPKAPTVYWDDTLKTWLGKEHGDGFSDMAIVPAADVTRQGAAVLSLSPSGSWASEATLQALYKDANSKRPAGTPMEIDGLVYTNNAIFSIARRTDTSGGEMLVNGGLVAADTGILAPGGGGTGLVLNYDVRTRKYIAVEDPTECEIRSLSYIER